MTAIIFWTLLLALASPHNTVIASLGRGGAPRLDLINGEYWDLRPLRGMTALECSLHRTPDTDSEVGVLKYVRDNDGNIVPKVKIRQGQVHSVFNFANGEHVTVMTPEVEHPIPIESASSARPQVNLAKLYLHEMQEGTFWLLPRGKRIDLGLKDQSGLVIQRLFWGEHALRFNQATNRWRYTVKWGQTHPDFRTVAEVLSPLPGQVPEGGPDGATILKLKNLDPNRPLRLLSLEDIP